MLLLTNSKTFLQAHLIFWKNCANPTRTGSTSNFSRQNYRERFLSDLGLKTAPYQLVEDLSSLQTASKNIGLPAILKTTRLGYDGKGQVRLSENSNLEEEYRKLENHSLVYEGFVDFEFEVSV